MLSFKCQGVCTTAVGGETYAPFDTVYVVLQIEKKLNQIISNMTDGNIVKHAIDDIILCRSRLADLTPPIGQYIY